MNLALYTLLCLIWGSTWLVIKVGYGGLGPLNVAALRFLVAGLVLVPVGSVLGVRWPRGQTEWRLVIFVGLTLFAGDYGLIYWAEQYLDSGLTAIVFAMLPLVTIALAHVYMPGDPITPGRLAGTSLAFAGVAALFADRVRLDASQLGPMLGVVGGTVCAAAGSIGSKRYGGALHPAALNAPSMLVGAAALAVVSLLVGDGFALPRASGTWLAILYLALAGSVVTFLIYFSLLKTWNVTSLSFISVFTPALALILGFVFLGERPTRWTVAGAVLILAGVTLALAATPRRAQ